MLKQLMGDQEVKIAPLLDPYMEKDLIIRPKYSVLSPNKFISDFELNPSLVQSQALKKQ